jgi:hypothetical protein
MDLAGRNAGEVLAREQARWLADQGKTLAALEDNLLTGLRLRRLEWDPYIAYAVIE